MTVFSQSVGIRYEVMFPPLKLVPGKPVELSAELGCAKPCQLIRLGVTRELDDLAGLRGEITINKLATNTQPTVAL